jgi:hypothetical protein
VKHYLKPQCRHKCRFVQVTEELWLCPHAAYGAASYLSGAIADARALLERAGGYDAVLKRIVEREEEQRAAARERAQSKSRRLAESVRYE